MLRITVIDSRSILPLSHALILIVDKHEKMFWHAYCSFWKRSVLCSWAFIFYRYTSLMSLSATNCSLSICSTGPSANQLQFIPTKCLFRVKDIESCLRPAASKRPVSISSHTFLRLFMFVVSRIQINCPNENNCIILSRQAAMRCPLLRDWWPSWFWRSELSQSAIWPPKISSTRSTASQ